MVLLCSQLNEELNQGQNLHIIIILMSKHPSRAEVIDVSKLSGKTVKFGATVTVVDIETDEERTYQIVGEVDSNVDPASTLQVAAALVRADKDFDLLIMPSANHGAAESPYGTRRRQDFFVRHLHGHEPRWK
jgi:hypothetical protein